MHCQLGTKNTIGRTLDILRVSIMRTENILS